MKAVCIVDDDNIFHYIAKLYFSNISATLPMLSFFNGEEAYRYLHSVSQLDTDYPAIILIDINMPVMNGWELVDHIHELGLSDQMDIYIVSSSISSSDRQASLSRPGVRGFLTKPVSELDFRDLYDASIHRIIDE